MGGGRLLAVLKENSNITSRELAEQLDIRPSSLTELLARLEKEELITRTQDDNDKRISRVTLTEKGEKLEAEMAAAHNERIEKAAACFTEEEAVQFCQLCERLGKHLEELAAENGENGFPGDFPPPPPPHCHMPGGFHRGHGEGDFPPPPPPHHFNGQGGFPQPGEFEGFSGESKPDNE